MTTEQLETIEELREALHLSDDRYNDVALKLTDLIDASTRLTAELSVMCEAYLAGDIQLVAAKVRSFATAYQRNVKPANRRIH